MLFSNYSIHYMAQHNSRVIDSRDGNMKTKISIEIMFQPNNSFYDPALKASTLWIGSDDFIDLQLFFYLVKMITFCDLILLF